MGDRHIPIIDEDKLDDIITALQALSAPSGTDVAISPTGMHIVTEDDVQGAISELDSAVDSVNSSLTNYMNWEVFYDEESFTRGVAKPLPTTWNELWITIQVDGSSTNLYQFYILKHYNSAKNYMMGYTLSANMTFAQIGITPSNNTMIVGDLRNNGTQINTTNVTLLYR